MIAKEMVQVGVSEGDRKLLDDMIAHGGFSIDRAASRLAAIAFAGYVKSMIADNDFRDDMLIRMEQASIQNN